MNEFSVRVVIADDHPVSVHGMKAALSTMPTIEIVGVTSDTTSLVDMLDAHACDVLVLDYVMPSGTYGDGQTLLSFLSRRFPTLRYVTVTMLNSPTVFRALQELGVNCIVSKSDPMSHLIAAIHAAHSGGRYLSPTIASLLERTESAAGAMLSKRETEIVRLFREGYKVTEIAEKLHRSKKTISAQKLAAMRKLGFTSDADLIRADGLPMAGEPDDSGPAV
ncbi:response regulator transcription factor [Burkholderia multivorans]|uniref:response regulator transcription factor n=1 Tax=Burkholderia multivorans TaxID=87883 RepID=UPI000CFEF197|nr:response regulator transcription factor [Burkholderia multivorans]MBR8244681.1 response regulator transcription factor [Burkholderia multivorans]MDR9175918.1 Transcriptional regulatory protein RcsB [Burkholderia multivorans]MDR9181805.1 Transcriptional regulatory protein RcsB [Burkholderia multivorans]MDR9187423.1 Transcriptional regulatory protein RcsB [Burkholderia multivorans]MDR9192954.1 Transcriptional regulatory protein RcsB [Burkholderia multivorans]